VRGPVESHGVQAEVAESRRKESRCTNDSRNGAVYGVCGRVRNEAKEPKRNW